MSGRRAPGSGGLGTVLPCKDGYFVAQASWRGGPGAWETVATFFERPELLEPRFAEPAQRILNVAAFEQLLVDATRERSMAEMFRAASEKHKMLLGIVQTPEDLARCPQLEARDFFTEVHHPLLGRLRVPFRLWNMSHTPARFRTSSPLLGQHNDEVYGALDLDRDTLERLRRDGVI